jgi:protease I
LAPEATRETDTEESGEEPRKALEDAGAEVEVVSIHDGEIRGFDHFDPASTVRVDRTVGGGLDG